MGGWNRATQPPSFSLLAGEILILSAGFVLFSTVVFLGDLEIYFFVPAANVSHNYMHSASFSMYATGLKEIHLLTQIVFLLMPDSVRTESMYTQLNTIKLHESVSLD